MPYEFFDYYGFSDQGTVRAPSDIPPEKHQFRTLLTLASRPKPHTKPALPPLGSQLSLGPPTRSTIAKPRHHREISCSFGADPMVEALSLDCRTLGFRAKFVTTNRRGRRADRDCEKKTKREEKEEGKEKKEERRKGRGKRGPQDFTLTGAIFRRAKLGDQFRTPLLDRTMRKISGSEAENKATWGVHARLSKFESSPGTFAVVEKAQCVLQAGCICYWQCV